MSELLTVESLVAFLTLTSLEIVLGIDNIVFIAILTSKLEAAKQDNARRVGLALAMIMRIALLLTISWIMGLQTPLFAVAGHDISGRDLILLVGGVFLIGKSTHEIHERMEGEGGPGSTGKAAASFGSVIVQIMLLDIVFSLDSVITAVGMVQHVPIMIAAIIAAVGIMMLFSGVVSRFVMRHPTIKMLALAFLLLIGVMLVAEGLDQHFDRKYVYFAMAFSLFVECLNMRAGRHGAREAKSKT
ncbi:MAG: TerC family protein [Candidatus Hydrogenedentes bacterium]|nr:TerC family protein [Candidatus Hydrogenedentota bacterium]